MARLQARYALPLCAGIFTLLLFVQPVAARNLPAGGLSRQDVAAWLIGHGLRATIHNDDNGRSIVSSNVSGVNFDVYFYGCEGERCASIQYAGGWTPLTKGTRENINDWNRQKRYIRAYLDSKNNVWGEYDVDISPGGTWEQLDKSLTQWTARIADFKAWVGG